MASRTRPIVDAGLQEIGNLEARIVQAHDEKVLLGVSAEEVARGRPAVVAQAKSVRGQLRREYLARTP